METVVSGIRPTGNLHLGNYFGAVKGFLQMMNEYNCYFFIADWHSLTTHPHPENIRNSVRTILAEYLACGLDPEKATIYVQSDVREVAELYLYLNMNAGIGELMRTTSFKDKARQQLHIDRVNTVEGDVEREIFNEGNKNSVSAGLLTYPTLMAADIIIHKAVKVPVGKDQEQNMEMARRFARRFNSTYGVDFFPEPASFYYSHKAIKVPGLDGSGKMGKSEGNAIYLIDDEMNLEFIENTESPRFMDCDDEHLDGLGDISNYFVRYMAKTGRNADESSELKKKLESYGPLYIKMVPYGGEAGTLDDAKAVDDEEAKKIMESDTIGLATMYMDRYADLLPQFEDGTDSREMITGLLKKYVDRVG